MVIDSRRPLENRVTLFTELTFDLSCEKNKHKTCNGFHKDFYCQLTLRDERIPKYRSSFPTNDSRISFFNEENDNLFIIRTEAVKKTNFWNDWMAWKKSYLKYSQSLIFCDLSDYPQINYWTHSIQHVVLYVPHFVDHTINENS